MKMQNTIGILILLAASGYGQAALEIFRATYGAGNVEADVTSRVQSLVVNGGLSIQVNGSTLGTDPVPNTLKTLTVEYRDGFFRRTAQARDFETMRIGNVAPEPLQITKALYGDGRRMADVTALLNRKVWQGRVELRVSNENLGGDPAPAEKKELVVEYQLNGAAGKVTVPEGEMLRVPAAATSRLRIISATMTADVTASLNGRIVNDGIEVPVKDVALGGRVLTVVYELDGKRQTATLNEGEVLKLSAAPAVSTLRILRASYGAGRRATVDVTRAVNERVADNMLQLTVNGVNLGGDPAPGMVKTLVVEYELDGKRQSATAKDAETLVLPPVESLAVISATYGVAGRSIDATRAVAARLADKSLEVPVNGVTMGGDPAPGTVKTLTVQYEINGRRQTATAMDGQTLRIPGGVTATPATAATPAVTTAAGACLYREPNYAGDAVCLGAGQDLAAVANWQNGFRSVRLNGAKSMEVFNQPNFGGTSDTITSDMADLKMAPLAWWRYDTSARVQSLKVR